MNEVFSFRRFGKLFIKHSVDHYRSYLMSIAVIAGVLILGGSFFAYMVTGLIDTGAQVVLFMALLIVAGTIFTSTIFSDLGEKKKSIPALLLPASTFEKFLVGWIYSYILFLVIFTILYYFALTAVIYFQALRGSSEPMMVFFSYKMLILFLIFSLLHSIALFGAIFFEKLHFIKTGFCFFISIGLLILFNTFWAKTMTGKEVAPMIPFSFIAFREDNLFYVVGLSDDKITWVMWVVVTMTIFFWVAAYFRLKEKRV
jgi:hypothetical protein